MRNNSTDILDFLADVHALSKVKSMVKGMTIGVNEDTLGAILKASIAQFIALEITKSNGGTLGPGGPFGSGPGSAGPNLGPSTSIPGTGRDSRSVNRYLPWLSAPPANTAAQGPREFLDCVAHIRLLSWLLLGSVNHTLRYGFTDSMVPSSSILAQPIPLDASCHIADHIQAKLLRKTGEVGITLSLIHECHKNS